MLYLLTFTPAIPAIIALLLSPGAGLPQRSLPSISISNEEPAEKLQSGITPKVSLNLRLLPIVG